MLTWRYQMLSDYQYLAVIFEHAFIRRYCRSRGKPPSVVMVPIRLVLFTRLVRDPVRMMLVDPVMTMDDPPVAIMPYVIFVIVAEDYRAAAGRIIGRRVRVEARLERDSTYYQQQQLRNQQPSTPHDRAPVCVDL
jgi:hypothetical protein